ncbi:unnamed protein product [Calypogeia fissa]
MSAAASEIFLRRLDCNSRFQRLHGNYGMMASISASAAPVTASTSGVWKIRCRQLPKVGILYMKEILSVSQGT